MFGTSELAGDIKYGEDKNKWSAMADLHCRIPELQTGALLLG
jgi:hypothetical protein